MKVRGLLARTILLAAVVVVPLLAEAPAAPAPGRVVAVADVHGAYEEFVGILREVGLIDDRHAWTGDATTFVQTGDVLDRGARSKECLDLLMDLEQQAPRAGGAVIALIGNHEVMNLFGDLRYVTPQMFLTFAGPDPGKRRDDARKEYVAFLTAHAGHGHAVAPPADGAARRAWEGEHPPGFFEHRDAFGRDGKYGQWIRSHHAVVQVGDGVFVHGGFSPALEFGTIREIDERVIADITAFDAMWRTLVEAKVLWRYMTFAEAVRFAAEEYAWQQAEGPVGVFAARPAVLRLLAYRNWITLSADSPLWYRGLATEPEDKLAASLKTILDRVGATYIVAGHSVVASKAVTTRLDNRVVLLDTGMLAEAFGGRASALAIQDGRFMAYQAGGTPRLLPSPPRRDGVPPGAPEAIR